MLSNDRLSLCSVFGKVRPNALLGARDGCYHAKSRLPSTGGPANRLRARLYDEQATAAQEIELRAAGGDSIVEEHGSGASSARPALARLVREIVAGDTLVVVRLGLHRQ